MCSLPTDRLRKPAPSLRFIVGDKPMRSRCLHLIVATVLFSSPVFAADELMKAAQLQFKPIPETPPALPENPASPQKLQLGKMLYFDPRLSASHAISCNSCHSVGLGGVDAQETSIGHHWQRGGRNAPTVFNAVFNIAQFWDGRAKDLEAQAGGPMVNSVEMASPTAHVAEQLAATPGYVTAFRAAFPGPTDPVTLENAQRAIAVFEATLITPNAPFGVLEKPGASFLPPTDKGRFMVTKTASDEYVFKVPTLRNIALTAPYFHTGKSWDLRQAVAVMGTSQLGAQLTEDEIDKITAFLDSLTGDQPKVVYPTLPP